MLTVRKGMGAQINAALVGSFNALRGTVAGANSKYHKDATPGGATTGDFSAPAVSALAIAAADATNTATGLTLVNELQTKLLVHFADAVAHKAADTTNSGALAAGAVATNDATTVTLAGLIKTAFNAHNSSTVFHYTADTNDDSTTITDAATARTSINAVKAALNLHLASTPAGDAINLVDP